MSQNEQGAATCFLTGCTGPPNSANSSIFSVGDKRFRIVGGTSAERTSVEADTRDIFGTPRGAQMLKELEKRRSFGVFRTTFTIDLTVTNNAYAPAPGDAIYLDPRWHPPIQTAAGPIPATTRRIIARELGHAVYGHRDSGPNRMWNVNRNENPIMNALGQPSRTQY